jgi:hypothetical protein
MSYSYGKPGKIGLGKDGRDITGIDFNMQPIQKISSNLTTQEKIEK